MDKIEENLSKLNPVQRKAVEYCDGPSLVIAGAGSGKTRVLVHKIVHLIYQGYSPNSIMALTFTNKAAREMRERIYKEVGVKARHIYLGTFHSIFSRIIKEHAEVLGFTKQYSIYDTNNTKSVIRQIIKDMNLDEKIYTATSVIKRISIAKNHLILPKEYKEDKKMVEEDKKRGVPHIATIYHRYFMRLRESNALDFDDLLLYTTILFRDFPEILRLWQNRIEYLLIDEYQDTNLAQYIIAKMLVRGKNKICVVGDDAQSIYSFRGANIENILNFSENFKETKIFKLEQNYRSTQNIVNLSNAIIRNNRSQHPKELFSSNEVGNKVKIYRAVSADEEAYWIARQIENLKYDNNISYNDIAILYRNNSQSRILEQKLRGLSIPFRIWGGMSFFEHTEIVNILSYFKLLVNENDDEALVRIINYPKRGIGNTTIKKLREKAVGISESIMTTIRRSDILDECNISKGTLNKINSFVNLIDKMRDNTQKQDKRLTDIANDIIHSSGIFHDLMSDNSPEGKQRQENMHEFIVSIEDYLNNAYEEDDEISLHDYLSEISLYTDQSDSIPENTPCVTMMTIHASKGLEFPYVFLSGVEEGTFPSTLSIDSNRAIEEERRLMYVAITRAEKSLAISYAKERIKYGRLEHPKPSRFLKEFPISLIDVSSQLVIDEIKNRGNLLPETSNFFDDKITKSIYSTEIEPYNSSSIIEKTVKDRYTDKFNIGDHVIHNLFGEGTIIKFEGDDYDKRAIIEFKNKIKRTLILKFATLNKKHK